MADTDDGRARRRAESRWPASAAILVAVVLNLIGHDGSTSAVRIAAAAITLAPVALPKLTRVGYVRGASDRVPEALQSLGLPLTLLDAATVQDADVVITMGCGETCPIFPGKRYEDWTVEDPKGKNIDTVRRIVDDVEHRVRALLADLVPQPR